MCCGENGGGKGRSVELKYLGDSLDHRTDSVSLAEISRVVEKCPILMRNLNFRILRILLLVCGLPGASATSVRGAAGTAGFHVAADHGEGYYIHMVFPILRACCCSLKTLQRCPR
jgi:hypothetical protein